MRTELEDTLSERLRREAALLVPDTIPPPLPPVSRSWVRALLGPDGPRWRAPVLAGAAVLVLAVTTTVVIQTHRYGSTVAAGAPPVSPVLNSPAAPFSCGDLTADAAQAGSFLIGVTDTAFCVSFGNNQSAGTGLKGSGPLRSLLYSESWAAGAVETSVDRVYWLPRGTEARAGTTIDLYSLGSVNGFAFPIGGGGLLQLYSGSAVVASQTITDVRTDASAASSSMAAATDPTTAPAAASPGDAPAQPSYPPGQSGPSQRSHPYPTNARGQTYGSAGDSDAEIGAPDLIAAVATNGTSGYVLRTDLELPQPTSISEALAQDTVGARTIPVYESDGVTKIGVFVVGTPATAVASQGGETSSSAATTTGR